MLYDKLSKGEDNKWIQGKGNGECLLDMVGVDAVALGHIMAVNELIKADGTLQRPQTTGDKLLLSLCQQKSCRVSLA